ncbi:MAG TPA: hypothetical protein VGB55_09190 [Tepidisphaeraceae bacterium]|jgi:hypothetical protein
MLKQIILLVCTVCFTAGAMAQSTQPASTPPAPTRVTVKIDNLSANEAIDAFALQTGLPLRVIGPPGEEQVKIDAIDVPVLDVLTDLMQQTELSPGMYHSTVVTQLSKAKPIAVLRPSPLSMLVITRVELNGFVSPPQWQPMYNYSVGGQLIFDSSMNVVSVSPGMDVINAVFAGSDKEREQPSRSTPSFQLKGYPLASFDVMFTIVSSQPIEKIDHLTGEVRIWQAIEHAELVLDNAQFIDGGIAEGKGLKASVSIPPNAQMNQMQISLSGPAIKQIGDNRAVLASFVRLKWFDQPLANVDVQTMRSTTEEVQLRIGIQGRGEQSLSLDEIESVTLRIPTKVRAVTLPIEIKNIAMP